MSVAARVWLSVGNLQHCMCFYDQELKAENTIHCLIFTFWSQTKMYSVYNKSRRIGFAVPIVLVCLCGYQYHMSSGNVHVCVGRFFTPGGSARAGRRAKDWSITQLGRHTVNAGGLSKLRPFHWGLHSHPLPTQLLQIWRSKTDERWK